MTLLLLLLAAPAGPRFEVSLPPGTPPQTGRLVVAVGPTGGRPNPLDTDPPCLPVLGRDADAWAGDKPLSLDATADTFPLTSLNDLPPGDYTARAYLLTNRDVNLPTAPGNRSSAVVPFTHPGDPVKLTLADTFPDDRPADTATVKFLHVPSKKLSDFHGRPMVCRVGVVLPPDFDANPTKRYGLVLDIGGFGTRYTAARRVRPHPQFVQVVPDGAGPFGDPYQIDSANNGPYGAALTEEVIPLIEKRFRCLGTPQSRFTTGGSTGGWVSFALQVFYPDFFNGCWSQCPDSVTFSRFERIDIYSDTNAFLEGGQERPAKRTRDGSIAYSVRHENRLELVLGRGGRWELGGRDWASWNAAYGPKGPDGLPVPLWDGRTGAINKAVTAHWQKYDLLKVLEANWPTLGPKLAGKIHLWVGEQDEYFLNLAVAKLKPMLESRRNPAFDGRILIEPGRGHESGGWTRTQMFAEMTKRAGLN
jgi:hypothetical protein